MKKAPNHQTYFILATLGEPQFDLPSPHCVIYALGLHPPSFYLGMKAVLICAAQINEKNYFEKLSVWFS